MHILITGAAGMIGRKLIEQLIVDRALNEQPIEKLTLMDIVAPTRPAGFSDYTKVRTGDLADPAIAMKAVSERPDVIFHLAGVVSGEAELNLEKGYHVNLDGARSLLEAIRKTGYTVPAQTAIQQQSIEAGRQTDGERQSGMLEMEPIDKHQIQHLRNEQAEERNLDRRAHVLPGIKAGGQNFDQDQPEQADAVGDQRVARLEHVVG